jgi:hypothetical protein
MGNGPAKGTNRGKFTRSPYISPRLERHLVQFPAGLYAVINMATPCAQQGKSGPEEVHLLPLPSSADVIHILDFGGYGVLHARGESALIRVDKDGAQLLLCFEQTDGACKPQIVIRKLFNGAEQDVSSEKHQSAVQLPNMALPDKNRSDVRVHVQGHGDVEGGFGHWIGCAPSQWIEGFSIVPPAGLDNEDLEYQAIIGICWDTPWCTGGTFCGSRGIEFPIAGFSIRLNGPAASSYMLTYTGQFMDGEVVGPITPQGRCVSKTGAPLVALRIDWVLKTEADNTGRQS